MGGVDDKRPVAVLGCLDCGGTDLSIVSTLGEGRFAATIVRCGGCGADTRLSGFAVREARIGLVWTIPTGGNHGR